MKQPIISVIVPIYNVEKYIHRCIDSLLAQTFNDIEIILVDDGSPDRCGEICDEYATMDPRVKVIHKKNGGVASARQAGTDVAKGEYIIHADPDDWVAPNMYEDLYYKAKMTDADVTICDYFVTNGNFCKIRRLKLRQFTSEAVLKDLFGGLNAALWNKLIRRNCYIKYGLHFAPGINFSEDLLILAQLLKHQDVKIAYLDKALYYYYQRSDSLVHLSTRTDIVQYKFQSYEILGHILPQPMHYLIDRFRMRLLFELWRFKKLSDDDLLSKHYKLSAILRNPIFSIKQKICYSFAVCGRMKMARRILEIRTI